MNYAGAFKVSTKSYKRSPWASIRGFAQFKRNMQKLAKLGDEKTLIGGFTKIAEEIKFDMQIELTKLSPPTAKYIRAKKGKALNLRRRGISAKPFKTKGKGKSFVAVNYKFAPHAHLIEFGTGARMQYTTGRRTGKLPKSGSKTKFAFFRPTVNSWRRSGRYVARVGEVVASSVDAATRGMTV